MQKCCSLRLWEVWLRCYNFSAMCPQFFAILLHFPHNFHNFFLQWDLTLFDCNPPSPGLWHQGVNIFTPAQIDVLTACGGIVGMPCTQCARNASFCTSPNSRTLALARFQKFFAPCRGFLSFLCIRGRWDLSARYPFWCYGGPFPVGNRDRSLSSWGYRLALSGRRFGPAPLQLGIWTSSNRN